MAEFVGYSVHRMFDMPEMSKYSFAWWMVQWMSRGSTWIGLITCSVLGVAVCAEIPRGCRYGGRSRFCVRHQVVEPPHLKPRESISDRVVSTIYMLESNGEMMKSSEQK